MLSALPSDILPKLFGDRFDLGLPVSRAIAAALKPSLEAAKLRKRMFIAAKHETFDHLKAVTERRGAEVTHVRTNGKKVWTPHASALLNCKTWVNNSRLMFVQAVMTPATDERHMYVIECRTAKTGTIHVTSTVSGEMTINEYGYRNGITAALVALGFH